jgi:hypothetical protein
MATPAPLPTAAPSLKTHNRLLDTRADAARLCAHRELTVVCRAETFRAAATTATAVFKSNPSVVHFSGFQVGQKHTLTLVRSSLDFLFSPRIFSSLLSAATPERWCTARALPSLSTDHRFFHAAVLEKGLRCLWLTAKTWMSASDAGLSRPRSSRRDNDRIHSN